MSVPSCTIPATFAAFHRQRQAGLMPQGQVPEGQQSSTGIDSFLAGGVPPLKAVKLFSTGFLLAFSGRWVWQSLVKKVPREPVFWKSNYIFEQHRLREAAKKAGNEAKTEASTYEVNAFQQYADGLAGIFQLALEDAPQRRVLLGWLGACILGYVTGSGAQGLQEAWVRREETRIRAQLIDSLKGSFKQSIAIKYAMDDQLKASTREQIRKLLIAHGIPNTEELLKENRFIESPAMNRHYFYEPTHRTTPVAFGGSTSGPVLNDDKPAEVDGPTRALLLGTGALMGLVAHGFIRMFTTNTGETHDAIKKAHSNIIVNGPEAYFINGFKNPKNLKIMAFYFAIMAAATVGKLFMDGLREIEVTRLNARTEKGYQDYNRITLDTGFHKDAEEAAVKHELFSLERDMPWLKLDRAALARRVDAILLNVGRNSSPKYFPMTPPVGLVVARG